MGITQIMIIVLLVIIIGALLVVGITILENNHYPKYIFELASGETVRVSKKTYNQFRIDDVYQQNTDVSASNIRDKFIKHSKHFSR